MRITIAGLVGALSLGNNLGSGDGDLGWVRVETRERLLEQSMLGRAVSIRERRRLAFGGLRATTEEGNSC